MHRFMATMIFLLVFMLCMFPALFALNALTLSSQRYNLCGQYACPNEGKFAFSASTQYMYSYSMYIKSSFNKNGSAVSEVELNFKVELKVKQCEGIMRVRRLRKYFIEDDVDTNKLYEEVSEHNLKFSFYDGSIYGVCPHKDETILSLNIKKGILSALQNKMKRFDVDTLISERDVNGLCPTYYNLERVNATTLVIRKVKDIAGCMERYQLHSIIPTSRFVFQMKYHKWAPLNSSVICHQTIDHGIPINIVCKEDHTLKLFESQNHTSNTMIVQELNLISENSAFETFFNAIYYPDEILLREDLSFNHKKPKKSEISELEESRDLLRVLCNVTSNEFQLDTATVFSKFIHTARHLSYDALKMLYYESMFLCSTGMKHVQDSLPFLRSTSSVSLMKDIIIAGNISSSTANGWLFAISLFSRPDEEVIKSVTDLLYDRNASDTVLLTMSTVLHSYCVWSSAECSKQNVINDVVKEMETFLNNTINENNSDKAIVILKALGNAGVVTSTIGSTLSFCVRSYDTPITVKLVAIEAYRRLPCDYDVKFLTDLYTNMAYDSELRIAAYLQLMRCPTYSTIKKVKQTLQDETVNQVGSFVWSHLRNTMRSSMLTRVEVQSILQDYILKNKFNLDFRKFSRNYETSFYINDYGLGGFVTVNVIFSPKSYIPRSLSANFTVTLFGETVNIMEVNIYLEGFEPYFEKVFRSGTNFAEDIIAKHFSSLRVLRSITSTIKDSIRQLPNLVKGNFPEPQISFAVKIFGNELYYKNYKGDANIRKAVERFSPYSLIKEFLNGQEIKFDHASVFMDLSYVAPTGAGVALNLDAVGIGLTNFDMSILVNTDDYFKFGKLLIAGKLKPKFSINFEGIMNTELVYKRTEIKVRSKLFTSSAMEGNFLLNKFDNMSLSFNLPLNKFDIFNMETELVFRNNIAKSDEFVTTNEIALITGDNVCFWPLLDQMLGLKICSTYSLPATEEMLKSPLFIFRGPFKLGLFISKSDPSAKIYIFRYNRILLERNNSMISLEFETPNSDIRRSMVSVVYAINRNYNLTVVIHTNKTIVNAYGLYRNTRDEKALNFNLDINGIRHIDFTLELQIKQDKRAVIYSPKMFFAVTSKPVAELYGTYKWVDKKGVSQCDIDLHFKTNRFDSDITGYIRLDGNTFAANIHVKYKFINGSVELLKCELKYADHSTKLYTALQTNLQLESTSYPEINFLTSIKYQKSQDHINVKVDFVSNPYLEDDTQKLYIQAAFMYLKSFNGMKLNTFLDIKKQVSDVNVRLALVHRDNPSGSTSTALIRYATGRDIVVRLDILKPETSLFHYEVKLNVTLPAVQQPMIINFRIIEEREKEYDLDFSGTWFGGHSAVAKGMFQDKSTHYMKNYYLKLQVRSRLFNEVLFVGRLTYNENDYRILTTVDYNNIKYAVHVRHIIDNDEQYETYVEYIYNQTNVYSINNHLSFPNKELIAELHFDRYRDVYVALRGVLKRWGTNFGVDVKWDVNRDPSQKFLFNIKTMSEPMIGGMLYSAKSIFEYPGHTSMASLGFLSQGKRYRLSLSLEMNPSSVIESVVFVQNEIFTSGVGEIGFKLQTPFDNWKETSLTARAFLGRQSFQANGSLVWQSNNTMMFDSHGSYTLDEKLTSLFISSSLNSSLRDLSALGFKFSYRSVVNEFYTELLLQPNPKYSIYASTSGIRKLYDDGVEYIGTLATKTPFLEYKETDLKIGLKLLTGNRVSGLFSFYLNENPYIVNFKGVLKPFDDSHLCLKVITPYEQYKLVNGKFIYAPDDKRFYLNFLGQNVELGVELIYAYNNITNFNLKLNILTPLSYFNRLLLGGMYNNGKALELMCGWNSFMVGFSGISYFESWSNLNYAIKLFTPIEAFKESAGELKIFMSDTCIIKAHVSLSESAKAGIILEYDTQKSTILRVDRCMNFNDTDVDLGERMILTNGLLILDTLLYPSISAMFVVTQAGENFVLQSTLSLLHLQLSVVDSLDYRSLISFKNRFQLDTSIDVFSRIVTNLKLNSTTTRNILNTTFDTEVTSFNKPIKGGVDVNFQYIPIQTNRNISTGKFYPDGVYNFEVAMFTPFKLLESCDMIIIFSARDQYYDTSLHVLTNYTDLLITSDLELRPGFFDTVLNINVTSIYFTVPFMRIQAKRDFESLEKEVLFSFKLHDITQGLLDVFLLNSVWYIDSKNYISLRGDIKTPFKVLDELKGNLLYSHEFNSDAYYLQCYMKYSNKTELKARAKLAPPVVELNLETSMEGLRSAHFTGTLQKLDGGQQIINAVMISNSSFRIQGWSSTTDNVPFALEGKLIRGKGDTALSSVNLHLKKTKGGYHMLASLISNDKTLHVETEITDSPDNTRLINLQITTSKGTTESLHVDGKLILQHPGAYIFIIQGSSLANNVRTNLKSEVKIWFRNNIAAVYANLDSSLIKGDVEAFGIWKPPTNVFGNLRVSYFAKEEPIDVLISKVYLLKSNDTSNITSGLQINLNNKWNLQGNITTLVPTWDDVYFLSKISLPNGEVRSLLGKLYYSTNVDMIEHLLLYTSAEERPCYTVGNLKMMDNLVDGLTAFKCGIYRPIYMLNTLNGKNVNGLFMLENVLKSNTLKNTLLSKINYKKPNAYRNLIVKLYYPPKALILDSDINFKSVSNFRCKVNATTLFPSIPHLRCDMIAATDMNYYHRFTEVYFHEKFALFNLTHVNNRRNSSLVSNDGQIRVLFPITTVHEAILLYKYDDIRGNVKGSSDVLYNNEKIIFGNFTRNVVTTRTVDSSAIHLEVDNRFATPLGINYVHQSNNPNITSSNFDLKRIEFFKLQNASALNFTGEIWSKTVVSEDWSYVKIFSSNRSIILQSHKDALSNSSKNDININLKPEIWLHSGLKLSKKITHNISKKIMDLSIAYPRRNFSVVGTFGYEDDTLQSDFVVYNHLIVPVKAVGVVLQYRLMDYNDRRASVILFHPAFEKNVTLASRVFSSHEVLVDAKLDLEYSDDEDRNVTIAFVIHDKQPKTGRNYVLYLDGNHPVTKLKLNMDGILFSESGVHLVGNNISYRRSYLPNHFWKGKTYLNTRENVLNFEKSSLRGATFIHGDYGLYDTVHRINAIVLKDLDTNITSQFQVDWFNKEMYFITNLTSDGTDRFQMESNIPENREVKLNIWRTFNNVIFPQVSFYAGLNHSRLLSSVLSWRTDIGVNILRGFQSSISYMWISSQESVEFWTQFVRSEASDTVTGIWSDAKPYVQDLLDDINDLKTIQDNINYFRSVLNDSYNTNEFFLRDIHHMYLMMTQDISLLDKFGNLPKIVNEVWESMGETGKVIKTSLIWFINTVKQIYEDLMNLLNSLVEGGADVHFSNFVQKLTDKFDVFIKELHISFISSTQRAINELVTVLTNYWKTLMEVFEPTFIEIVHYLEATAWSGGKKLIDFIYARKEELMSSPYFIRSANFTHQLDLLYKDLTKNDIVTNVKKYFTIVFNAAYEYYYSHIPYRQELMDIGNEILGEIQQLYNLPLIGYTVDNIKLMYKQVVWLYDYLDINNVLQKSIPYLYKKIVENSYSALENEMRIHKAKTKFYFEPEIGVMKLEQKLPFPWHAFNETPIYEEISEYKTLRKYRGIFSPSTAVFWAYYNRFVAFLSPSIWFPPFNGYALIVGSKNVITFDGQRIEFDRGKCLYLLSHDFIDNSFSVTLESSDQWSNDDSEIISIFVDEHTISVDLIRKRVEIDHNPSFHTLPAQLNSTWVYYENGMIVIKSEKGVTVECNLFYQICSVHVSGWYFGKISGLLGTMNNEPYDDMLLLTNKSKPADVWSIMKSRGGEQCNSVQSTGVLTIVNKHGYNFIDLCSSLFVNRSSDFETCFREIDPSPYLTMCKTSSTLQEVCTFALSYVKVCMSAFTALRIPNVCVTCSFDNSTIQEGTFRHIEHDAVTQSTDVVFIVEAKYCNKDVLRKKHISQLISSISKELENSGLYDNRYGLVLFGGDGVYNNVQSVVLDSVVFSNATVFPDYFQNIVTGNGSCDIFSAIRMATKLHFRPGVSKTFILLPCSSCDPSKQTLDYSVLHHAMMEKSITLHTLMENDFTFDIAIRSQKIPFGLDSNTAYTRNDYKLLKGDVDLKKQIKLTKSVLGYCIPLTIESNGALFTMKRLESDNSTSTVRKFFSVFAKRVALTAGPVSCQNCECNGDLNGIPYMDCISCLYPPPINFDFGTDEESDPPITLLNFGSSSADGDS